MVLISLSPLSFLDLPTEIKCRIMGNLDIKSLLNMSLTSKSIHELILGTNELLWKIEMAQSELVPAFDIRSSLTARKFIHAHRTARLTLPLDTSPCLSVTAPDEGVLMERLFRGLLACRTDEDVLHVWDISRPDFSQPPEEILTISTPDIIDFVIEPEYNLLVLLCYRLGDITATIQLLDLASQGTQPHPWATSHIITHLAPAGDIITAYHGRQQLMLRGGLLAFVYNRDLLIARRGIIWEWRTGNCIYDSMNMESSSTFHDLLLLPTPSFLISVSTSLVNDPTVAFGAWIELHNVDFGASPVTSRLVAEFRLPEFEASTQYYLGAMEFNSSEPPNWKMRSDNSENKFPFVYNPNNSVHVLHIWYRARPEFSRLRQFGDRVYLVISNKLFVKVLNKLARRDDHNPLRVEWDEWGPWWTSMWGYQELGLLVRTSSVSGTRICCVTHPVDRCIELLVVDFNMNFPCAQRNCHNPLAHFSAKTFRSSEDGGPMFSRVVETWLPYHTQRKRITIPTRTEDDNWEMCTTVLMDEERIILSTCEEESEVLDPTNWRIIYMLHDGQNSINRLPLWPEDTNEERPAILHDAICRLCKEKPHTDSHILLECTANPDVVELRRVYLIRKIEHNYPGLYDAWCRRSFDELLDEITACRGAIRMSISLLVLLISVIYELLPRCSELVLAQEHNPASVLFVAKQ